LSIRAHASDRADTVIRAFVHAGRTIAGEDLRALVEMLRYALPSHFAYEERPSGFLDALSDAGAHAAVERLRSDHQEFRATVAQLGEALDRGEPGIPTRLASLARKLREHERIESVYAARLGMPLPIDVDTTRPAGIHDEVATAIARIATEVGERAQREQGSLVTGLRFSLPSDAPWYACIDCLEAELVERGFDFIDIEACPGDGPPRLLSVALEPGWA